MSDEASPASSAGAEQFVQEELVSSLGLAGDGRVEINRLLKLAGQGEDVIDLAGK